MSKPWDGEDVNPRSSKETRCDGAAASLSEEPKDRIEIIENASVFVSNNRQMQIQTAA
jgi:hypothetical protein